MLPAWYLEYKEKIEQNNKLFLDDFFKDNKNDIIANFSDSIYYSMKGGKRIRAIFTLQFYIILSGKKFSEIKDDDDVWKICFAIECLHGYSLVHDDLPALDNDLYRRGELTTWNKFGEVDAILCGDAMQAIAFEALGSMKDEKAGFKLIKMFSQAVGPFGMVGGQVLDIFYEKHPKVVNVQELTETHNRKTGALITFSIIAGVLLSGYKGDITHFYNFGRDIGLAFQVKDDLLDALGTFEETGKSVGGEKKGFVHLIGVKESKKYLEELIEKCQKYIESLEDQKLNFLVKYIGNRKK